MLPAVLTANAQKILDTRYIDKAHDKTVEGLWDRVSMGKKEYRDMMAGLIMLPNSPALFNMGLPNGGTSSACFVFSIQDSLLGDWPLGGLPEPFATSIFGTRFKAAAVAKAGGGVGYYLGNIRAKGTEVKSTHKRACGPVAVLRDLNGLRSLITQGGKRDLAQMGVLNADHPDIREFIHVKDEDPQALGSFNISVSWKNQYLKQIAWDVLGSEEEHGVNEWTKLWWEQAQSAWKSGDPGTLFWDLINVANPTPLLGDIEATNPCGEVPELSDEPCNLGSLSLVRFLIKDGPGRYRIDWDGLKHYTRLATRFLDDILDNNNFPHPDITRIANLNRKLGLGVMALADVFAYLAIPYGSQAAVDLSKELAKHQNEVALKASIELAHEKGAYPQWENESAETKAKFPWCRNATRTSIAPTGTISIIAGVWGAIEPFFAFDAERTTYEGLKMNDGISDATRGVLKEIGHIPQIASEIDWRWHVRHQAAWQAHTDLGVSKTINLPNSATVKDISDAYRYMWETGCKGGTVFRDGCRDEQVLVKKPTKSVYATAPTPKIGLEEAKEVMFTGALEYPGKVGQDLTPEDYKKIQEEMDKFGSGLRRFTAIQGVTAAPIGRRKLPDTRKSVTHKFKIGGVKAYLTVGLFDDGTPGEIFLNVGKQGSTLDGMMDSWAVAVSTLLQHGVTVGELVQRHGGTTFPPQGFTGNDRIPSATSIPDYVVRWLGLEFAQGAAPPPIARGRFAAGTGDYCPDCSAELVKEGNCKKCLRPGCGFSKC